MRKLKLACFLLCSILANQSSASNLTGAVVAYPGCGAGVSCKNFTGDAFVQKGTLRSFKIAMPAATGDSLLTFHADMTCKGPTGTWAKFMLTFEPTNGLPIGASSDTIGIGRVSFIAQDANGNFETQPIAVTSKFTLSSKTLLVKASYRFESSEDVKCSVYGGSVDGLYTPKDTTD